MKRLIFINRFFFPDQSASSQLLSDLAFYFAETGTEVHVITSRQLYEFPQARLPAREIVRKVQVRRVPVTRFGRATLLGRGIDYLSFYLSTWRMLLAITTDGDIVIAETDPPLVSIVAMRAAQRRGASLVNWLQDIYPEVAIQLGVRFLRGPILRCITHLRDRALKVAAANVVIGNSMAEQLRSRGVNSDRIHVVPNWTDDEEISSVRHSDNPLRREWGLEDKFVVGYSGNLGRAHEFHTVLHAAERLKIHSQIVFLLIGGGQQFRALARCVKDRNLDRSFRFLPYQHRSLLKHSLCVPDVHWISLKPEAEGLIFPSKFYGIAAAGRPVIAIAARDGEIARLVQEHGCGLVVEPGNSRALADSLVALSKDAGCVVEMGRRARAMLEAHFARRQAFARWRSVLENIA
jgi:colanic acid biosynthesis glycosyl transferase WcaI